jgi:hypothetical protein
MCHLSSINLLSKRLVKYIESSWFYDFFMENTKLSSNSRPAEHHNFVPYICTVPVDEWRVRSVHESTCNAKLSLPNMDVQFKEMYLINGFCH